jgi:hypothetical protein
MGFAELDCSGSNYCPGQVCCATYMVFGQQRVYTGASCTANCSGAGVTVICTPGAPNACPFGGTCQQSGLLGQPYHVCG